jgi:hypothetical protein
MKFNILQQLLKLYRSSFELVCNMITAIYNFNEYMHSHLFVVEIVLMFRKFHRLWILSFIVAVSFIDGGNRRTQKKPPICRKSRTIFMTYCCTPRRNRDSNSQHQW